MVEVRDHHFKLLTDKKVKPEESFINAYVDKCLEYEGTISSTRRIRRILDARYEKADLNKVVYEHCQRLNPNKR